MSLDAETWNSTNKNFFNLATKLINLINQYETDRFFDLIIDIGVGSGNITEMMAKTVDHGKIIGIDVDSNMIEFAKHNKSIASIEYVLADLSRDWSSISEKLTNHELKVSLVFSNMCIDLIKEKSMFIQNLKRLLRKNGHAYFNFPIFPNPTRKLKDEEKGFYERHVKVPDCEGQTQIWINLFEANGFKIEHKQFEDAIWHLTNEDLLALLQFFPVILDTYTKSEEFNELPNDIQNKLLILSMDGLCNWKEDSVNWNILDQLKSNNDNERKVCKWKIVYLVCKTI